MTDMEIAAMITEFVDRMNDDYGISIKIITNRNFAKNLKCNAIIAVDIDPSDYHDDNSTNDSTNDLIDYSTDDSADNSLVIEICDE